MKIAKSQSPASVPARFLACCSIAPWFIALILFTATLARAQESGAPASNQSYLQLQIEKQRNRLSSSDTEERRDAIMQLGAMKHPASSELATRGLSDSAAIVRATAAKAVLSLPSEQAAAALLPVLQDKDEFVRQEVAYALGEARSSTAVSSLISILDREKKNGVRGAAAVALGQIGDETAVIPLAQLLGRRVGASGLINRVRRAKRDENEFVRRAAAHSLGQIRSRAAVPALSAVLLDEGAPDDVRREAAASLGLIGDVSSVGVLRSVLTARDPYLARIAYDAIRRIAPDAAPRPM